MFFALYVVDFFARGLTKCTKHRVTKRKVSGFVL